MQVESVTYRGHLIKAGVRGAEAVAVAFQDETTVLRATGADVQAAVAEAKSSLDKLLNERFGSRRRIATSESEGNVGTVDEYFQALKSLRLNQRERAMLIAHARAPDRILTAQQLADAGWGRGTSHTNANSHYGRLGGRFADYLELKLPTYDGGKPLKTCALAESIGGEGGPDSARWRWRMHDELAAALEKKGMK
jgi:hypothetical protein